MSRKIQAKRVKKYLRQHEYLVSEEGASGTLYFEFTNGTFVKLPAHAWEEEIEVPDVLYDETTRGGF